MLDLLFCVCFPSTLEHYSQERQTALQPLSPRKLFPQPPFFTAIPMTVNHKGYLADDRCISIGSWLRPKQAANAVSANMKVLAAFIPQKGLHLAFDRL